VAIVNSGFVSGDGCRNLAANRFIVQVINDAANQLNAFCADKNCFDKVSAL
jgi:hypothetical protein